MLDCPGADPAVGLPEADSVVVSSRGEDDRVAAHSPLIHIHAGCEGEINEIPCDLSLLMSWIKIIQTS